MKILDWALSQLIFSRMKSSPSEVFNSIRINAIVDELQDSGLINNDRLDKRIKDNVMNVLRTNKSA